jgi:hypothetical protein
VEPGALDTDDGRALAGEVTELLESELVRFAHRVDHDHGIELDRARGALVLLTALLRAGVTWTARSDCAPARLAAAFEAMARRDPSHAEVIRGEIAAFESWTANVAVIDPPAYTTAERLRAIGAAPETWWWAAGFERDHVRCWKSCAGSSERLVQVALAIGISADPIVRALAGALIVAATRAKTRRPGQRNDLVALLGRFVAAGPAVIAADKALVAKATSLAFEMAAAQQPWWTGAGASGGGARRSSADGIAEVAVLSFQIVELFTAIAAGRPADPERFGAIAGRADRALAARGLRLAALLQRELDPAFSEAVKGSARSPAS